MGSRVLFFFEIPTVLVRSKLPSELSLLVLSHAFLDRVVIFLVLDSMHLLALPLNIQEFINFLSNILLLILSLALACDNAEALEQEMVVHVSNYSRVDPA
jgi:hypothetical protein